MGACSTKIEQENITPNNIRTIIKKEIQIGIFGKYDDVQKILKQIANNPHQVKVFDVFQKQHENGYQFKFVPISQQEQLIKKSESCKAIIFTVKQYDQEEINRFSGLQQTKQQPIVIIQQNVNQFPNEDNQYNQGYKELSKKLDKNYELTLSQNDFEQKFKQIMDDLFNLINGSMQKTQTN